MAETWYPKAIRRPISTLEYWSPRPRPLISICNHITDGLDSRDFLQNADNESSVHFLVREENGVGVVYQFMPIEWAAWGNGITSQDDPYTPAWLAHYIATGGNPNHISVSIEHERKWPFTTTLPDAMKAATIELHKWLCATFPTIPVDRDHIIGHYQIDHIRKANCPGGPGGKLFPFDDIIWAINASPQPPPPPPVLYFPQTGQYVQHGFHDYYLAHPERNFGYPLTGEMLMVLEDGNTYTVQWFERGLLQYSPTTGVQEARVGYYGAKAVGIIK